jgi:hypothetical protein
MTEAILYQELLRALLTLIAGGLVARLGLSYYFRQKEYEIVKQRYLEQSVDLILSELESISRVFANNWMRALQILKMYRDAPDSFDVAELKSGFIELSATDFHRVAHHRLSSLVQSDIVWTVYQLALSRHSSLNSKATIEVPHAIRMHIAGKLEGASHGEFIKLSFEELRPLNDQSDHFSQLIASLQAISGELERARFGFKDVLKFHKRANIKEAVRILETHYKDDLSESIA